MTKGIHAGVSCGEAGVGVVPGLVVVVLDVQVTQLGVLYPQRAAVVVDVLPVKGQLGCLGSDHVWVLYQGLQMRIGKLKFEFYFDGDNQPETCCSW